VEVIGDKGDQVIPRSSERPLLAEQTLRYLHACDVALSCLKTTVLLRLLTLLLL